MTKDGMPNTIRELLFNDKSIGDLVNMVELTTNMKEENVHVLRGWLFDEIESRDSKGFNAWLNSEEHYRDCDLFGFIFKTSSY